MSNSPTKSAAAPTAHRGAPKAGPSQMVIFGALGDLTKRLLVPALYNLSCSKLLDDNFQILGIDHTSGDDAAFRKGLGDFLHSLASDPESEFGAAKIDPGAWEWLAQRLSYQVGDFEDEATYAGLGGKLGKDKSALFYLATAPRFFADVAERLAKAGLAKTPEGGFRRLVVEKPFGVDLDSARELNRRLLAAWDETQIYRIDHFLGKETVRNIMTTRFANGVFEPLWNRLHVDSVQITAAETVGVEARGAYYDKAGALRDMIPNHLFQLLAMVAMEPPNSFGADAVRQEKGKVIEAIRTYDEKTALARSVRGQYGAGTVEGRKVAAYRDSPNVDRRSGTETYVALELAIDNWRWAGVPFFLRTGKAMSAHDTEIAIRFKKAPASLFETANAKPAAPNDLVLQIQPREGISLDFEAKTPGPEVRLAPVRMDFLYADWFKSQPATGYETLIYDCLIGDQTLFKRAQDIEYAWAAVMPLLKAWAKGGEVEPYAAGTDGPPGAAALLAREHRSWRPVGTDPK
ncbi:MAG: glucose-6-phosphate dehydrogenase [Caulobacteraceae bacterium]